MKYLGLYVDDHLDPWKSQREEMTKVMIKKGNALHAILQENILQEHKNVTRLWKLKKKMTLYVDCTDSLKVAEPGCVTTHPDEILKEIEDYFSNLML